MERALVVTADTDDFVYGELWARAVSEACAARGLEVELHVVTPPRASLASELGPDATPFPRHAAIRVVRHEDAASALAAIDPRPARIVVASLRGTEVAALDALRPGADGPWVLWDRHTGTDISRAGAARDGFVEAAERRTLHVFTFRPLGSHRERFVSAGVPAARVHVDRWVNPVWLWSSRSRPLDDGRIRVFVGGDTGRDYPLLARAMEGVPLVACCVTSQPVPIPGATVVPRLPLHRFRDAMSVCDVVAIPLVEDLMFGLGTLVLAMGLGRAVVASDTKFVRLYAEPGVDALVVPCGDAAAMHDALVRLASDAALRATLGRAAAARARRELDADAFAARMVAAALDGSSA